VPKLDNNLRYLQIAFNYDQSLVRQVLPHITHSDRILIEAGTPYIKREGMGGIRLIKRLWPGHIVADLKVADGALGEVEMAHQAGATAATILGTAPTESINLFIERCQVLDMLSMVDLIGVMSPSTSCGR
jgi:bifunctional enzyme Fae/Hps